MINDPIKSIFDILSTLELMLGLDNIFQIQKTFDKDEMKETLETYGEYYFTD